MVRPCWDSLWWFTILMAAWLWTWWPTRTRTRASAPLLARNALAPVGRCVEQAHLWPPEPPLEVSCFRLVQHVRSGCEVLLIAVPPGYWPSQRDADPARPAERLLHLAQHSDPRRVALGKRKPKPKTPKGYVAGATVRIPPKPKQEDPERGGSEGDMVASCCAASSSPLSKLATPARDAVPHRLGRVLN